MLLTECVQCFETFKNQFYNTVALNMSLCATLTHNPHSIALGDINRQPGEAWSFNYETRMVQPVENCGIHTFHGFNNKSQHYFVCVCSAQIVKCLVNVVVSELSRVY